MRICNAPGCARRAVRPCFDCGEWRCEEHLHAAVHHRKSAIVHLCPNCLHAHVNEPDRLRLEGYVDERAERAADPLAPRETRRELVSALENNATGRKSTALRGATGWRLERDLASPATKRTNDRLTTLLDR